MNKKKLWKKQGGYRSFNTGEPMILVLNKETGGTELKPLQRKSEARNKALNNKKNGLFHEKGGIDYRKDNIYDAIDRPDLKPNK